MNILNICSSDERSALELGVAEVAGIVLPKKKNSFHLTVHWGLVQNLMLLMHTEYITVRNLLMLRKGEWKQRALL